METVISPPGVTVGQVKSFGPFGPKYKVGQPVRPLDDGDWIVEVTMIETGETAEYRYTHMLDDPEAN